MSLNTDWLQANARAVSRILDEAGVPTTFDGRVSAMVSERVRHLVAERDLLRSMHARELERVAAAVADAAGEIVDEHSPTGRGRRQIEDLDLAAIIAGVRLG